MSEPIEADWNQIKPSETPPAQETPEPGGYVTLDKRVTALHNLVDLLNEVDQHPGNKIEVEISMTTGRWVYTSSKHNSFGAAIDEIHEKAEEFLRDRMKFFRINAARTARESASAQENLARAEALFREYDQPIPPEEEKP